MIKVIAYIRLIFGYRALLSKLESGGLTDAQEIAKNNDKKAKLYSAINRCYKGIVEAMGTVEAETNLGFSAQGRIASFKHKGLYLPRGVIDRWVLTLLELNNIHLDSESKRRFTVKEHGADFSLKWD